MASRHRRFWTAAETGYQSEGTARRSANALGIECYFPQYRTRARAGVRRVLPLFDRYILVRLDARRQDWEEFGRARGVRGFLRGADGGEFASPARIEDIVIADLRAMEGDDGYIRLEDEEPPAFAFRDQVLALKGTFRDQRGEYRGIDPQNSRRAQIAFKVLGREVMSSQPRYDLARA